MKMDYDLLVHAPSGLNPLGQRELSLRGLRIQLLENLVLTKNQNDVLDLTDNDLRRLQNFPLLPRLSTLLLSNNRLGHIEPDIGSKLTGLQTLVLNNNELSELGDLEPLKGLRNLKTLSLYDNPVTLKPHYRDFVIVSLPQVQCLDFNRVTPRERENAHKLFAGPQGQELLASLGATTTSAEQASVGPASGLSEKEKKTPKIHQGPSAEETKKIKEALSKATTLEEITRLERMLQTGQVPQR